MSGKALAPGARYRELVTAINEADRRYYVDDAPTLTDAEYDALRVELNALEAAHPELVTPESPSQRVGPSADDRVEPAVKLTEVRHERPMLRSEERRVGKECRSRPAPRRLQAASALRERPESCARSP